MTVRAAPPPTGRHAWCVSRRCRGACAVRRCAPPPISYFKFSSTLTLTWELRCRNRRSGLDTVNARPVARRWSARPLPQRRWSDTFHCMLSTLLLPVPPNPSTSWDFFYHLTCSKKNYLIRMISVLNTDCTVEFYMMRRTKLDPTCIYFEDVWH